MSTTVYMNGEYVPESEAKVSVNDRGFLYGDGIFDTMRAYSGVPFRLEDHLERLKSSARELMMTFDKPSEELAGIIYGLLEKNGLKDAYLRITVTRGIHNGDLSFDTPNEPTIVIMARPVKTPAEEDYEKGVDVQMVKGIANPPVLARYKTTSYLPYLQARDIAHRAGKREAIIIDRENRVLEAATANVFVVKDGEIVMPPHGQGSLPGIAQTCVLEITRALDLDLKVETVYATDLFEAEEVFLTNSVIEVMPVATIDGKQVGNGNYDKTRKILEAYREMVENYVNKRIDNILK